MTKNIKEIEKELMGKSLNSFHRKTGLPQLERNNEMQDGILDGILSQVDDAYIEKTEQSNVIHLDGSGDGVVVLDSIEGNTMVNLSDKKNICLDGTAKYVDPIQELKIGQTYTIIFEVKNETTSTNGVIGRLNYAGTEAGYSEGFSGDITTKKGLVKIKWTIQKEVRKTSTIEFWSRNNEGIISIDNIILLEGDWTNKDIPATYFEGLQSSFEEKVNDEGKYEIEILMNNENLFDTNNVIKDKYWSANNTFNDREGSFVSETYVRVKEGMLLTSISSSGSVQFMSYDENKKFIERTNSNKNYIVPSGVSYVRFSFYDTKLPYGQGKIVIGNNVGTFIPQKQNKIKLLINEPLRSISTMKDKLCIKDGKLKVERNLGQVTFSGNEDWQDGWQHPDETDSLTRYYTLSYNEFGKYAKHPRRNVETKCLSDNFSEVYCFSSVWGKQYNYIAIHGDSNPYYFQVSILKSMVGNDLTKQGFKNWIKNNGLSVVYPLAEPYYEEVLNEYGEPILLEGYENGTIYIDSTIVPTATVRYTPKMESFKTLNEVSNNNTMLANDINDNIIPYMMDVDLMIMEKEMALPSQINIRKMEVLDMTSMQKRTQDMLERLIKGKTLTEQECKTRITTYLNAGKITDAQAEELMLLIDEVYA